MFYFLIVDANIAPISQLKSNVMNVEQSSVEKKYCIFVTSSLISNKQKLDNFVTSIENSLDSKEYVYMTVSNMEESMSAGRLNSLGLVYVTVDEVLLQPQPILANTAAYITTTLNENSCNKSKKQIDERPPKEQLVHFEHPPLQSQEP